MNKQKSIKPAIKQPEPNSNEYWQVLNKARKNLSEAMETLNYLRLSINNGKHELAGAQEVVLLNQLESIKGLFRNFYNPNTEPSLAERLKEAEEERDKYKDLVSGVWSCIDCEGIAEVETSTISERDENGQRDLRCATCTAKLPKSKKSQASTKAKHKPKDSNKNVPFVSNR